MMGDLPSGRFKPESVLLQGLSSFHIGTPSSPAVLKLSIVSESCVHKYALQNCTSKANTVLRQ